MLRAILLVLIITVPVLYADESKDVFEEAKSFDDASQDKSKLIERVFSAKSDLALVIALRNQLKYLGKELPEEAAKRLASSNPRDRHLAVIILSELYGSSDHEGASAEAEKTWSDLKFSKEAILNAAKEFDLVKSDEKKMALFQVMLTPQADKENFGIKAALDRAKKNPKVFFEALFVRRESLFAMSENEISAAKKLVADLEPKDQKQLERIFLTTETPHIEKWLKLAWEKKDAKAILNVATMSLPMYAHIHTPQSDDFLLKILSSNDKDFYFIYRSFTERYSALNATDRKALQGLLAQAILKKAPEGDPMHDGAEAYSRQIEEELSASDISLIDKLIKDPAHRTQAFVLLDSLRHKTEVKGELEILQKKFSESIEKIVDEKLKTSDLTEKELNTLLLVRGRFGQDSSSLWLRDISYLFEHKGLANGLVSTSNYDEIIELNDKPKNFMENWENRSALTPFQEKALLWSFCSSLRSIGGISSEKNELISKWALEKLESLSSEDLGKVIHDMNGSAFSSSDALNEWLEKCVAQANERSLLCKKAQTQKGFPFYSAKENFENWDFAFRQELERDPSNYSSNSKQPVVLSHALKSYNEIKGENDRTKSLAALILAPYAEAMRDEGVLKASDQDLEAHYQALSYDENLALRTIAMSMIEQNPHPEKFYPSLGAKAIDACETYCSGAQKLLSSLTLKKQTSTPFNDNPSVFKGAVTSLKLLTLYKASSLCPQNDLKSFHEKLLSAVTAVAQDERVSDDPLSLSLYASLQGTLKRQLYGGEMGASGVYENAFTLQLLTEFIEKNPKPKVIELKNKLQKETAMLLIKPALDSSSGSGTNLYAYSAMLNAFSPNDKLKNQSDEIFSHVDKILATSESPLQLPYHPLPVDIGANYSSERAAIARALTLYTALYRNDPRASKKENEKKHLLEALEKYFGKYFYDLSAHLQRDNTHMGPDRLAPYYLYPSLFYSAYAFESLSKDPTLSVDERVRLATVKKDAENKIKLLLKRNGDFRLTGDDEKQEQSDYKGFYDSDQALGLMSLSTFADCSGAEKTVKKATHK